MNFFDPRARGDAPRIIIRFGRNQRLGQRNQFYFQMIQSLGKHYGFDVNAPFEGLT